MRIIGITGPSGAGKSYLSEFLRKKNIPVVDADETYHSLLVPPSSCLDAIKDVFGDGVINSDGSLDRKALSAVVFGSEEKLALLNKTVLGFVIEKIKEILGEYERAGHSIGCVDAPTLIESGFYAECDRVISVISDKETRVSRIMARDGISIEAARARVDAQCDDGFYTRLSHTVIENNGDASEFEKKCEELYLILTDNEEDE